MRRSTRSRCAAGEDASGVRAIVLTHTPPVFCAGADLKERAGGVPDSAPFVRLFTRLMDAPQPTIAAVKGPVRAGGIGLMASCDLVVVRDDVEFALTEVRLGLAAAMISVPIFRRVNSSHIAAAFLTGERFSAEHARRSVSSPMSAPTTRPSTASCVAVRGDRSRRTDGRRRHEADPATMCPACHATRRWRRCRKLSDTMFASDDAAEGMRAFAEKRPPRWQPLTP